MSYSMLRFTALLFVVPVMTTASYADQESYVPWSEVRVDSPGVADSGRVSFAAKADGSTAWASVEVAAFGQQFTLDARQLAALNGYPPYSFVMTYSPGYEDLGGHTVYWKFKRSFLSGETRMEREIVISISKGKGLDIHEWPERPTAR